MRGATATQCARVGRHALKGPYTTKAALCGFYVLLGSSGPILMDWVKSQNGGIFPFSIPALTFHAHFSALLLGLLYCSRSVMLLKQLLRWDMMVRFCSITVLFTLGDMLSFHSLQHLDVGTYSLVGKAFAVAFTVVLSRAVLLKRQTPQQCVLVVLVTCFTVVFSLAEASARGAGVHSAAITTAWFSGLALRASAVLLTSFAAVLQELLFRKDEKLHFLQHQCWMAPSAMATSFLVLRYFHRQPLSELWRGFGDPQVLLLLCAYVANGLTAGLMVKRMGAAAKALCVPVYLGVCHVYAVRMGTAVFKASALAAWAASTTCILAYALTTAFQKAMQNRSPRQNGQVLPK